MQTVLISGGTGFIGSALARRLSGSARVIVLSRQPADGQVSQDAFESAVAEAGLVFNLAGTSGAVASNLDPAESLATSNAWQLRFLAACAKSPERPRVVFASSRLVYGKPESLPVGESHPVHPDSFYATHKLCIEHYHRIFAQHGGMSYTICRISNPYGLDLGAHPSQEYGFLNRMVRWAVEGSPLKIFGEGTQLRDYIFIDDLVDALLLCGREEAARNETFNIGSGVGTSIVEAAREVSAQSGAAIEHVPWPAGYIDVETGDFVNNIGKARARLGFVPRVSFAEGISRTITASRDRR